MSPLRLPGYEAARGEAHHLPTHGPAILLQYLWKGIQVGERAEGSHALSRREETVQVSKNVPNLKSGLHDHSANVPIQL